MLKTLHLTINHKQGTYYKHPLMWHYWLYKPSQRTLTEGGLYSWYPVWMRWIQLHSNKQQHIFLFGRFQISKTGDQECSDPSPMARVLLFSLHIYHPVWPDGWIIFQYLAFCNNSIKPEPKRLKNFQMCPHCYHQLLGNIAINCALRDLEVAFTKSRYPGLQMYKS